MSATIVIATGAVAVLLFVVWIWVTRRGLRATPAQLRPGSPLPDFRAVDEQGDPVRSVELHGSPTVILFVRGNWCPFCSRQVSNLTQHYRDIVDLGAQLILITPKPLETTRRVAEFFKVEFDFWLDDDTEGNPATRPVAGGRRAEKLQQGIRPRHDLANCHGRRCLGNHRIHGTIQAYFGSTRSRSAPAAGQEDT